MAGKYTESKEGFKLIARLQEAGNFPDFGKLQFLRHEPKLWSALVETQSTEALDLLQKLVIYESTERLTASEVTSD